MASISSANAVFMLGINTVYPVQQQVQGWSADEGFATEDLDIIEVKTGLDGVLSAGYMFVPIKMSLMLQADSVSISIFDNWYAAQKAIQDVYFANGIVRIPATQRSYSMTNGLLTGYHVMPDMKKTLEPLKYTITWQSIVAAPF